MKLTSHDLQDGGKLPNRHVFNGMGYDGDNLSPHLMWDDVPAGTKKLCRHLLRPGCADRFRLVALGGSQPACRYPGFTAGGRFRSGGATGRGHSDPYRFW
ncbi:UPF0098 protein ybhB (plasmid) [Klebsiella aerogenes]|nr:UPF0098 protein ybhB [Klebsiella aerogenes]